MNLGFWGLGMSSGSGVRPLGAGFRSPAFVHGLGFKVA